MKGAAVRGPALLVALLVALAAAAPAAACRCPWLALEEAWDRADLVVIGEATDVREVAEPGKPRRLEVVVETRFHQGRPFKGDLAGITLATATDTAGCGLPVEVGETYLLFAALQPDAELAWFTTCSGSRLYAGGPRASQTPAFPGLPVNRIVPRLYELAAQSKGEGEGEGEGAGPLSTSVQPFHTTPACWEGPRIYHAGRPPENLRDRVKLTWRATPRPDPAALALDAVEPSPGAYRAWARNPDTSQPGPWDAVVLVDSEGPQLLWIELSDVSDRIQPRWVNEKLLFLRAPWGRAVSTDLLVDVEAGAVVYQEKAIWGEVAYQQYREACADQCPCQAEPGSASAAGPVPRHAPADGQPTDARALRDRLVGRQAFLGDDWDGRVFTRPGEPLHTRSSVPREASGEVAAEVLAVREVAGALWLEVALYAVSPCQAAPTGPPPRPAHRGWVPAYSAAGDLVAGAYPGGC